MCFCFCFFSATTRDKLKAFSEIHVLGKGLQTNFQRAWFLKRTKPSGGLRWPRCASQFASPSRNHAREQRPAVPAPQRAWYHSEPSWSCEWGRRFVSDLRTRTLMLKQTKKKHERSNRRQSKRKDEISRHSNTARNSVDLLFLARFLFRARPQPQSVTFVALVFEIDLNFTNVY